MKTAQALKTIVCKITYKLQVVELVQGAAIDAANISCPGWDGKMF